MMDEMKLAELPRTTPLKVKMGPASGTTCVIGSCPVDDHSYAVKLPRGAGTACTYCAVDHGFELDWGSV